MSGSDTLIVVPTYREAENIAELFTRIWRAQPSAHILVVDDNSDDGTADIVRSYQKDHEGVHIICRSGKLGLGTAYIAGFKWALERDYQYIIEMDADLSHDPDKLGEMLSTLGQHDVAIGSRYIQGGGTENWSLMRKLISRFGSLYARTILGMRVRDLTGGFNGWRRHVLETIGLDEVRSEGYSFQIELKFRAGRQGYALREFPILFTDRRAGQSKMSGKIVIEAMLRVWWLKFFANPNKS